MPRGPRGRWQSEPSDFPQHRYDTTIDALADDFRDPFPDPKSETTRSVEHPDQTFRSWPSTSGGISGRGKVNERQERARATIGVKGFRRKGLAINAVFGVLAVAIAVFCSRTFRDRTSCSLFQLLLIHTIVLDVAVVQPAALILTLAYRWLMAEGGAALWSQMHPIDGQWRDE